VFALGLLFQEILIGKPVFDAANDYARIYRILNEPATAPSMIDARIDAQLDAIVLKAVDRAPEKRYADAGAMKADLDRYRVPHEPASRPGGETTHQSTFSFLLRRMSLKTDFPALSASFGRINELTAKSDQGSLQVIADLVIRDFALTQKLLKVVNSAEFSLGKVTRVSQAISMMGVARLRSLAIGMMLAGANRRGPRCPTIAAALTDFFVAGVIARNIGRAIGLKSVEELFICGMFSRLGQLLTLYYLKDEHDAIQRLMADRGIDANAASKQVMGMSFDDLGVAVAQRWHFPEVIVSAMRALPAGPIGRARDADEHIHHCAAYARELCSLARIENQEAREAAFVAHLARFAPTIDVEPIQVRAILGHSMDAAAKYVAASELDMSPTTLLDGLHHLATHATNEAPAQNTDAKTPAQDREASTCKSIGNERIVPIQIPIAGMHGNAMLVHA
jgi:HD-like signal output (HDOD) protein